MQHVDLCIQLGDEISFRKGDLKKTSILPLGSHKVKFIQIDAGIMTDGIWPMAGHKVGEVTTPLANLFPGIAALCPRGSAFWGSLKTDGVSACVVFPKANGAPDDKCVWKPFKGLVHVEGTDMQSVNPPILPPTGRRLIGIDPGRRDMFVGVVHDGGKTVKCTTRCCYGKTGRRAAAQLAEKRFSTVTSSGKWLPTEKQSLPTPRVVQLIECLP